MYVTVVKILSEDTQRLIMSLSVVGVRSFTNTPNMEDNK